MSNIGRFLKHRFNERNYWTKSVHAVAYGPEYIYTILVHVYYKLYRFLTVYMGSHTRLMLIWPRGGMDSRFDLHTYSFKMKKTYDIMLTLYSSCSLSDVCFMFNSHLWPTNIVHILIWRYSLYFDLVNLSTLYETLHIVVSIVSEPYTM